LLLRNNREAQLLPKIQQLLRNQSSLFGQQLEVLRNSRYHLSNVLHQVLLFDYKDHYNYKRELRAFNSITL